MKNATSPPIPAASTTAPQRRGGAVSLRGRAVLLTGAARGIGRLLAAAFADAGADLAISARPESRGALDTLATTLRDAGGRVVVVPAELTDHRSREDLVDACRAALGRIDVLVNNAGIEMPGPFANHAPDGIREIVETNLVAPMHLARLVLPELLDRRDGHIVNIGALIGRMPAPFHSSCAASKAGLMAWSSGLREELRDTGVGVSVVCPGFVGGTGMHARLALASRWRARDMPPQAVRDAVLQAITHDIGETLVAAGWGRPLLAMLQLFPAAGHALLVRTGLRDLLAARASACRREDA